MPIILQISFRSLIVIGCPPCPVASLISTSLAGNAQYLNLCLEYQSLGFTYKIDNIYVEKLVHFKTIDRNTLQLVMV